MTGNSDPPIFALDPVGASVVRAADPAAIGQAAALLRQGGLVAVPTETVYGLAARADDAAAVASIYRAKGRPAFNPLIVHVADVDQARRLAHFDAHAEALASAFWPGPMTLVLPLRDDAGLAAAVSAGLPTIALRVPAHRVMQAVLAATALPLAAPSANRSGGVSPTAAAHVEASLTDGVELILDDGPTSAGLESTIVAVRPHGWQVLRPGPIGTAQLAQVLGSSPDSHGPDAIEAPGQLASHYAPGKPMRLEAVMAEPDEFHIGFGSVGGDLTLSAQGDLSEAAAGLYAALHRAAAAPHARIAVAPIGSEGIGAAIEDRLRRAAA